MFGRSIRVVRKAPVVVLAIAVIVATYAVSLGYSTCSNVQQAMGDPAYALNSALMDEGAPTVTPEEAASDVLEAALDELAANQSFRFDLQHQERAFTGVKAADGTIYAILPDGSEILLNGVGGSPAFTRGLNSDSWAAATSTPAILPLDVELLTNGNEFFLVSTRNLSTGGNLLDPGSAAFLDYHMVIQGLVASPLPVGEPSTVPQEMPFAIALRWKAAATALERVALLINSDAAGPVDFDSADTVLTLFGFDEVHDVPAMPMAAPDESPPPSPGVHPTPEFAAPARAESRLPGWHSHVGFEGAAMLAAPRTWLLFEVTGAAEYDSYLTPDDNQAISDFHGTGAEALVSRMEALDALTLKDHAARTGIYGVALTVNRDAFGWTAFQLRRLPEGRGVVNESAAHRRRITRAYGSIDIDLHPTLLGDLPAVRFSYQTGSVPGTVPSLMRIDWLIDSDNASWLLSAHVPFTEAAEQVDSLERIANTLTLN